MNEPYPQLRADRVRGVEFWQQPQVLRRTHYPIAYRAPERRQAMLELPTPKSIRSTVCEVYAFSDAKLNAKEKHKTLAEARHVAIWFMHELLKMSYPELGREFMRDHTSCISAIRRIDREITTRPLLCARMADVAARLRVQI